MADAALTSALGSTVMQGTYKTILPTNLWKKMTFLYVTPNNEAAGDMGIPKSTATGLSELPTMVPKELTWQLEESHLPDVVRVCDGAADQ